LPENSIFVWLYFRGSLPARLVPLVQAGVKFPDGKTRILPDLPSDSVVDLPVDATPELAIHTFDNIS
jgi:hypothetical protein